MAITAALPNSFKRELLAMSPHTAADVYKIALFTTAANLSKATTAYGTAGEATGTGYTAGGQVLAGFSVSLDGDTATLDWTTDPVWADSSITARGALIYNATRGNAAVSVLDFGANVTSTNAAFTVQFPVPGAATGLIRFG